jgi:signal transduction histidine kinase
MTEGLRKQKELEERLRDMERRSILAETAATLSHEIRNPLNLINLTADHIGHQYLPAAEDDRRAFLDLITNLKAQVQQLNRMVSNFLSIGKPMKIQKSAFHLDDLVLEVETLVKQQLVQKEISLRGEFPEGFQLYADQEQIRLVFLNLILNAIAAIDKKGAITLTAVGRANSSVVSVMDTGRGIPEESLPHIFEPYYSGRPGGTGLGLTLCHRIIEEHGGDLKAMNRPEGGMHFEITLPDKE